MKQAVFALNACSSLWVHNHLYFLWYFLDWLNSVQFSHSVVSNSLWPHRLQHARLPFHHQLPGLAQTHVHQVGDPIQPSHSLLSSTPPAFNLYQHQGLFQWVSSSHQVAKLLEFQVNKKVRAVLRVWKWSQSTNRAWWVGTEDSCYSKSNCWSLHLEPWISASMWRDR